MTRTRLHPLRRPASASLCPWSIRTSVSYRDSPRTSGIRAQLLLPPSFGKVRFVVCPTWQFRKGEANGPSQPPCHPSDLPSLISTYFKKPLRVYTENGQLCFSTLNVGGPHKILCPTPNHTTQVFCSNRHIIRPQI